MATCLRSMFVTATLLAGCSASSGKTGTGPTYCAQSVGAVDSCVANATTGPVEQCGPESPVCTPPGQAGGGVWACCSSTVLGDGVRETTCPPQGSGDASCPCVGCDDTGL